jgi:hypothetical protein
VRIGLLGLFLGLVAGSGATCRTDGAADDGTGRTRDRATDCGACQPTGDATRTGTGLVVTFSGLASDGTTGRADHATDDRTRRATDRHPDGRAAEGSGTRAERLLAAFLVLRGGAIRIVGAIVVELPVGIDRASRLVVRHLDLLLRPSVGRRIGPTWSTSDEIDGTDGSPPDAHRPGDRAYQRCVGVPVAERVVEVTA